MTQCFAIARTGCSTFLTVGSFFVSQTCATLLVGWQAIILQQDIKKVGREQRSFWQLMDDFANGGNEGKIVGFKMPRFGIQRLGQMLDIWKDLVGEQEMFGHHNRGVLDRIKDTATESTWFWTVLSQTGEMIKKDVATT